MLRRAKKSAAKLPTRFVVALLACQKRKERKSLLSCAHMVWEGARCQNPSHPNTDPFLAHHPTPTFMVHEYMSITLPCLCVCALLACAVRLCVPCLFRGSLGWKNNIKKGGCERGEVAHRQPGAGGHQTRLQTNHHRPRLHPRRLLETCPPPHHTHPPRLVLP